LFKEIKETDESKQEGLNHLKTCHEGKQTLNIYTLHIKVISLGTCPLI